MQVVIQDLEVQDCKNQQIVQSRAQLHPHTSKWLRWFSKNQQIWADSIIQVSNVNLNYFCTASIWAK